MSSASKSEYVRAIINNSENNISLYRGVYASINRYKQIEVNLDEWKRLKSRSREYLRSFVDGEALVLECSKQLIMLEARRGKEKKYLKTASLGRIMTNYRSSDNALYVSSIKKLLPQKI